MAAAQAAEAKAVAAPAAVAPAAVVTVGVAQEAGEMAVKAEAAKPETVVVAAAKEVLAAAVARGGTVQASCSCSRRGNAGFRRGRCNRHLCNRSPQTWQ